MPGRNSVVALALALAALATGACGGTSSETPWPVEPDSRAPGPRAESARPPSVVAPEPSVAETAKPAKKAPPPPTAEP